ncbi:MAG: sterol desaturase family protein [Polyangiaceae bacterium]
MLDPIVYATPLFGIALLAEGLCLSGTKRAYSFRRVTSALGCLAYDQLVNAATVVAFVATFTMVHAHFGTKIFTEPEAASSTSAKLLSIVGAVILHDILYYAYHRLSHRVNVLWAVHVVHHQSRHYDLTVSLRQGTVATWVTYLFYMPMAFVVSPTLFVQVHAAYQIYQFFVHTELLRRLGPLEWVFATPSHHRVHHGKNAAYIDRNYGGFFIVFDRMLGTFTEERDAPDYGVPGDYDDARPGNANLYLFARLFRLSARAKSAGALLRLWFGPPEASPEFQSSAAAPKGQGAKAAYVAVVLGLALSVVALFVPMATSAHIAFAVVAIAFMESGFRFLRAEGAEV